MELINWAEISEDDSVMYGTTDSDSTPDDTQFNGDGETDDLDDDNITDEDGTDLANDGDEDDHDPALISVPQTYDLALTKKLTSTGIIKPGDTVTFAIELTNQ